MAIADHTSVSAFTIDASDFLPYTQDFSVAVTNQTVDGTVLGNTFDKQCITKKTATFTANLSSDNGDCLVTGLDVSALTIASINFLAYVESLTFNVANQFRNIDGISDEWTARQFEKQVVSATCSVLVPADAATTDNVILGAFSSTLSAANATLAFTVNSVAFSVDLVVTGATHKVSRGDVQMWDFTFAQRADTTAPTGTGSLLAKSLTTPGTDQAWVFTSKAAGGLSYSANCLCESFSFTANKQDAIVTNYTMVNNGAVTVTATV